MIPKVGYMYIDNYEIPNLVFLITEIREKGDRYTFMTKTIVGKPNMYSISCSKSGIDGIWSMYYAPISNAELVAKML